MVSAEVHVEIVFLRHATLAPCPTPDRFLLHWLDGDVTGLAKQYSGEDQVGASTSAIAVVSVHFGICFSANP